MTRNGSLLHLVTAAIFVIAGLRHALWAPRPVVDEVAHLVTPLLPLPMLPQVPIPSFYLVPDNPLMWALLVAIWAMVLLDAVGQWIDPTDSRALRDGRPRIWPLIVVAMGGAALWPALLGRPALLTLVAGFGAGLMILGARRAAGRHRPAVGFFAGWATAVASAALAQLASTQLGLPAHVIPVIAILPAAAIGMAAQVWIGPSIGYSAALIWAFCGLAISTMGSDPMIALAAILGISAMASVLVRAAS